MSNPSLVPFIPEWRVSLSPKATEYTLHYEIDTQESLSISQDTKNIHVKGHLDIFSDGQVLAYLAFSMLEIMRQGEGQMTAHAAAVAWKDKGIVIFGERGHGKTSAILRLCQQYGYRIIANDLAILGYDGQFGRIYGGTKIIGLRLLAMRNNFPELSHLFSDLSKESWVTKVFLSPKDLNIDSEHNIKPLSHAFMIHLDNTGIDQTTTSTAQGSWMKVYLYENFTRYIRGTCLPFIGGSDYSFLGYRPSFDTPEFHATRVSMIRFLLEETKITSISSGHLDALCNTIHRHVVGG